MRRIGRPRDTGFISVRPLKSRTRHAVALVRGFLTNVPVSQVIEHPCPGAPGGVTVAGPVAGVDSDHVVFVDGEAGHDRVAFDRAADPQHLDIVRGSMPSSSE